MENHETSSSSDDETSSSSDDSENGEEFAVLPVPMFEDLNDEAANDDDDIDL